MQVVQGKVELTLECQDDLEVLKYIEGYVIEHDSVIITVKGNGSHGLKFQVYHDGSVDPANLSCSGELSLNYSPPLGVGGVPRLHKGLSIERIVEVMKGYLAIEGVKLNPMNISGKDMRPKIDMAYIYADYIEEKEKGGNSGES